MSKELFTKGQLKPDGRYDKAERAYLEQVADELLSKNKEELNKEMESIKVWAFSDVRGSNEFFLNKNENIKQLMEIYKLQDPDFASKLSKMGTVQKHVATLQYSLAKMNFVGYDDDNNPLKIDGVFGPNTLYALLKFQRSNNLNGDGIAGPQTNEVLLKAIQDGYVFDEKDYILKKGSSKLPVSNITDLRDYENKKPNTILETQEDSSGLEAGVQNDNQRKENGLDQPRKKSHTQTQEDSSGLEAGVQNDNQRKENGLDQSREKTHTQIQKDSSGLEAGVQNDNQRKENGLDQSREITHTQIQVDDFSQQIVVPQIEVQDGTTKSVGATEKVGGPKKGAHRIEDLIGPKVPYEIKKPVIEVSQESSVPTEFQGPVQPQEDTVKVQDKPESVTPKDEDNGEGSKKPTDGNTFVGARNSVVNFFKQGVDFVQTGAQKTKEVAKDTKDGTTEIYEKGKAQYGQVRDKVKTNVDYIGQKVKDPTNALNDLRFGKKGNDITPDPKTSDDKDIIKDQNQIQTVQDGIQETTETVLFERKNELPSEQYQLAIDVFQKAIQEVGLENIPRNLFAKDEINNYLVDFFEKNNDKLEDIKLLLQQKYNISNFKNGVFIIQLVLNKLGFKGKGTSDIFADGDYGAHTFNGIYKFQLNFGLKPTGLPDELTLSKMVEILSSIKDTSKKNVGKFQKESIINTSDGLTQTQTLSYYKFFSSDGNFVGESDYVHFCTNGMVITRLSDGKFYYVNGNMKPHIPQGFDFAGDFKEGIATVKLGNNYFFIDETGERKFNGPFLFASDFVDGKALIKVLEGGVEKWKQVSLDGNVTNIDISLIREDSNLVFKGNDIEKIDLISNLLDNYGKKGTFVLDINISDSNNEILKKLLKNGHKVLFDGKFDEDLSITVKKLNDYLLLYGGDGVATNTVFDEAIRRVLPQGYGDNISQFATLAITDSKHFNSILLEVIKINVGVYEEKIKGLYNQAQVPLSSNLFYSSFDLSELNDKYNDVVLLFSQWFNGEKKVVNNLGNLATLTDGIQIMDSSENALLSTIQERRLNSLGGNNYYDVSTFPQIGQLIEMDLRQ